MDPRTAQNRKVFFGQQNETMLYGILAKNFIQRGGAPLSDKQQDYLSRSLEFQMSELYQNNPQAPVQSLNKEVLARTGSDFQAYLQREQVAAVATPDMWAEPSRRFEQLQADRQRSLEAPRPPVPEYVKNQPLKEDDQVSAMELYEQAKARRNMEASAQAEAEAARRAAAAKQPVYLMDQNGNGGTGDRPDPRMMYQTPLDLVIAGQAKESRLMLESSSRFEAPGRGDVNMTLAKPSPGAEAARGTLQQDLIIKQQDIQQYKETEYNLSIFSADRKWEFNTDENRYNFSVNLYSGNPTNGVSIMPKGTARFKNITRIEFVKAILPVEGIDLIVKKSSSVLYDSSLLTTVYSLPFVTLNVEELDTNNYGTNDAQDRAFGLLQYDANWIADTNSGSRGFTGYIPKHMKCQRVYTPTPLAALTKMTIQLQQPNGTLISDTPDTLDVSGIIFSDNVAAYMTATADVTGSVYADTSGEYIWIDSRAWFSRFTAAPGDRVIFRNLNIISPTTAQADFLNYIQRATGHLVVATAYSYMITTTKYVKDGANAAGYSRFIIIRNQFNDPTTGSTALKPFGGAGNNNTLRDYLRTYSFLPGRLLNMSHQVQLIFRVITRDYDSTSIVRPDNL